MTILYIAPVKESIQKHCTRTLKLCRPQRRKEEERGVGAIDTISTGEVRSGSPRARPASRRQPLATLASAIDWLENMLDKRRGRRALLSMTDEQLKDIGVSRADAFREARRLYWLW